MKKKFTHRKRLKHGFKKHLVENYRFYLPITERPPVLLNDTGMNVNLAKRVLPRMVRMSLNTFRHYMYLAHKETAK